MVSERRTMPHFVSSEFLRHNKKGVRWVFTAVLTLLAACGGDDGPTDPGIRILNNSAFTLVDVYYSDCAATSFGDDRLDGTIAPGASRTFTDDVNEGCYDILVVTDTGGEAIFNGQQIAGEGATTITVTN
jgi:hypothetical protein